MLSRHKTYGLALPEVLVSLSLIAMSALSVTLAGAHAIASSYTASRQHAAWRLTSELSAWLNARGHLALDKLPEDPSELINKNSAVPDCYAQTCTAQDAARFFLIDWYRRLHERLPGARLVICRDSQPWDEQTGHWRWPCNSAEAETAQLWLKLGWPQAGKVDRFLPAVAIMQPEAQ